MTDSLPPFPVDDATLDLIEHALRGHFDSTPDGDHTWEGSEFGLAQLLTFMSRDDEDGEFPTYGERDVLRALLAEVRRLRAAV